MRSSSFIPLNPHVLTSPDDRYLPNLFFFIQPQRKHQSGAAYHRCLYRPSLMFGQQTTSSMTVICSQFSAYNSKAKTLHPQAINKTKTVYCHIKFLPRHCKVEIQTPTKQTFKQFDMHAEFNIFLDQKSSACKFFIPTIQTLNLSCTAIIENLVVLWKLTKKNY